MDDLTHFLTAIRQRRYWEATEYMQRMQRRSRRTARLVDAGYLLTGLLFGLMFIGPLLGVARTIRAFAVAVIICVTAQFVRYWREAHRDRFRGLANKEGNQ